MSSLQGQRTAVDLLFGLLQWTCKLILAVGLWACCAHVLQRTM